MDIGSHHILFRGSRIILLQSDAFTGFRSLDILGEGNWQWLTLARPFLRVGAELGRPERSHVPDDFAHSGPGRSLRVLHHTKDSLKVVIRLDSPGPVFMGPPGTFKNFGGDIEQEFLIHMGYQAMAEVPSPNSLLLGNGTTRCLVKCGSGRWTSEGAGFRIDLDAGETVFGVAIGYGSDDLEPLADAAMQEESEALASRNRTHWEGLTAKLPVTVLNGENGKSEEALWVVACSELSPEGLSTGSTVSASKTAYARGMFLWDTAFCVRGYAPYNPDACRQWLDEFIRRPGKFGQLAGALDPQTRDHESTQVPIFAWAANAVFAQTGDHDFLQRAFDAGMSNFRWWMAGGSKDCGGLPETGAISYDNSPIYDPLRVSGMHTGKTVNPDIVAAVHNDACELRSMAGELGDSTSQAELDEAVRFLRVKMHEHLYHAEDDFYYSKANGEFLRIKVSPALHAISAAPEDVARRIAGKYIRPGSVFWPVWGIATVATDEPSFDPDNYWRGMIWGPTNRLVVDALDRRGFTEHADLVADHTLELFQRNDSFYEVFQPDTGTGRRGTHFSGFSAGVYLDLLHRKFHKRHLA